LSQNFGPLDWRPGPVKVGQKTQNTPTLRASPKRTPHPNQNIFLNRIKKTCRIRRGFEQLSSYSGWRVIVKKTRANLLASSVVKGNSSKSGKSTFKLLKTCKRMKIIAIFISHNGQIAIYLLKTFAQDKNYQASHLSVKT